MNIYKYLGLNFKPTFKGNAFQGFNNKTSLNDYLLKQNIISKLEHFARENPELVSRRVVSELEANTPF